MEVGGPHSSGDVGEGSQPTRPSEGGPCQQESREGTMTPLRRRETLSPSLSGVATNAIRQALLAEEPDGGNLLVRIRRGARRETSGPTRHQKYF